MRMLISLAIAGALLAACTTTAGRKPQDGAAVPPLYGYAAMCAARPAEEWCR